jgi:hypothetical protein
MTSHLEHDLDNAREDLKIFLNEEGKKGFGTDVFLCVLQEAVLFFEDMLKEDLRKSGKKDTEIYELVEAIKEKAANNVGHKRNWPP